MSAVCSILLGFFLAELAVSGFEACSVLGFFGRGACASSRCLAIVCVFSSSGDFLFNWLEALAEEEEGALSTFMTTAFKGVLSGSPARSVLPDFDMCGEGGISTKT